MKENEAATPAPEAAGLLPKPDQLDFARLLESISIEDWLVGMQDAARYVVAVACQHDPHLQKLSARLALLQEDVAEIATEDWPLVLVEVDADLERCLADWPQSFLRWSLDLVRTRSNGQLEWKPEILLRLARGRRARGEGDAATLARLEEAAALLVEQARQCLEDEHELREWEDAHHRKLELSMMRGCQS